MYDDEDLRIAIKIGLFAGGVVGFFTAILLCALIGLYYYH